MTELEIAWLAGYLEGEGCFTVDMSRHLQRVGQPEHMRVYLHANSTDKDVLDKVGRLIDSPVRERKRHKEEWKRQWHTELSGARAITIMESVLPYMGIRRSFRIREILTAWKTRKFKNRYSHRISKAKWIDPQEIDALVEEVMAYESNQDPRTKPTDDPTIRDREAVGV